MDLQTAANVIAATRVFGGGTFTSNGEAVRGAKYIVGGAAEELIVNESDDNIVIKAASYFNHNAPKNVGLWVYEGNIYFDVVDLVDTEDEAVALGTERGELAIYDAVNDTEIFLPREQTF